MVFLLLHFSLKVFISGLFMDSLFVCVCLFSVCCRWVRSLRDNSSMALARSQHYLKNVSQFLQYVKETPTPTCGLSRQDLVQVTREPKASLSARSHPVVLHQLKVKERKEATECWPQRQSQSFWVSLNKSAQVCGTKADKVMVMC